MFLFSSGLLNFAFMAVFFVPGGLSFLSSAGEKQDARRMPLFFYVDNQLLNFLIGWRAFDFERTPVRFWSVDG